MVDVVAGAVVEGATVLEVAGLTVVVGLAVVAVDRRAAVVDVVVPRDCARSGPATTTTLALTTPGTGTLAGKGCTDVGGKPSTPATATASAC